MSTTLFSRLMHGLGAQVFAQFVQVFVRLAEVPLLLGMWGAQQYGEWLMIAAIPSYLALSDGGFNNAASHDMAMRVSRGDRAGALNVFRSSWILISIVSTAVAVLVSVTILVLPVADWLGLSATSGDEFTAAVLVLVVFFLIRLQVGLLNGSFWCEGRYGTAMVIEATMRLLEFVGLATAVVLGFGLVGAAVGYVVGSVIGFVIYRVKLAGIAPWLRYGRTGVSTAQVKGLLTPALASLAFPLGDALNVQGLRLVVGVTLGPAAVAVFAPLRTLSQLALQPKRIINLLMEPEMALAYGRRDDTLFEKLFRQSSQAALWLTAAACVVIALVGAGLLDVWTRGQVSMDWLLFGPLLIAAAVNPLWSTPSIAAYATNRHQRIAVAYISVYGALVLLMAYCGAVAVGLEGVGLTVVVAELGMIAYVLPATLHITQVSLRQFALSLVRPPTFLALFRRQPTGQTARQAMVVPGGADGDTLLD